MPQSPWRPSCPVCLHRGVTAVLAPSVRRLAVNGGFWRKPAARLPPVKHKLLSIEAAAIAAGVSKRSVERWLAEGRLTRYEARGRIRVLVDVAELRELVKPKPASRR